MARSTTGRVAARQLSPEGGSLAWSPGGLDRVRAALEAELDGPLAGDAVDDLLRLRAVLQDRRGSPAAAAALADLLRATPGALAVARRRHLEVGGIDQLRTFARREGRTAAPRAPSNDSEAPEGSVPLKALFGPVDRDRARATARRRKEAHDGRG